jgi:hypothetical protein
MKMELKQGWRLSKSQRIENLDMIDGNVYIWRSLGV